MLIINGCCPLKSLKWMRDSLDVCQQILHALGHLPLEAWIPKVVDIQSGTLEKTAPRFLKAEQKPRFSAYGFVGIRHEKTEMYSISSTFMSMYLYMNISHSCDCLHINICVWFFQYTACWNIETHDFYCCMILSYHVSCRWKSNEFCCLSSWFGTCESWVQPDCLTRKKKKLGKVWFFLEIGFDSLSFQTASSWPSLTINSFETSLAFLVLDVFHRKVQMSHFPMAQPMEMFF